MIVSLGVAAMVAVSALSPPDPPPVKDAAEPYGSSSWVEPPAADAAASKLLRIRLQNQAHVAGSWAAVGATIASYHGRKVTPNGFCARAFGAPGAQCPVRRSQKAKLPRMRKGFGKLGIAPGQVTSRPPSYADVVKEIDAGRPVAVRVHWTVGGGHMLVVYGYNAKKQQVYWGDPWPTADNYQWAGYRFLVKNNLWHMTGAVMGIGGAAAKAPDPRPARRVAAGPGGSTDTEPFGRPTFPAAAVKSAKLLRINQQIQRRDQWCWSADGSTVAAYFGRSVNQETFCKFGRGRPAKARHCPNEPQPLTANQTAFRRLRIKAGVIDQRTPSFNDIRAEIDRGRPVLAGIRWSGGGGHALTIFGYDLARKWVFWADPWGSSPRYNWASYRYFRKNSEFALDHVLKQIGPKLKEKKRRAAR